MVRSHSIFSILSLGLLLLVIFACWEFTAQSLYVALFGLPPEVLHTNCHEYLRDAARLEAYRIRHRNRFHLCRGGAEHQRRLISPASRPRWRRPGGGSDFRQSGAGEPCDHGAVGIDRRGGPSDRLLAAICRARSRGAGSRAFELASLPQGRGTGRLSVTPSSGVKTRPNAQVPSVRIGRPPSRPSFGMHPACSRVILCRQFTTDDARIKLKQMFYTASIAD